MTIIKREKRLKIYKRDKYTCRYCGQKFQKYSLTIDHKIPKSLNGSNRDYNLTTCCKKCNRLKGNKIL